MKKKASSNIRCLISPERSIYATWEMAKVPDSPFAKRGINMIFWSLIQSKSWASSAFHHSADNIIWFDINKKKKNERKERKKSWAAAESGAGSAHCRVCGPHSFYFTETHRQPIPWWQISALSNPAQDFLLSESVRIAPVNTMHMPSSCCTHSATKDQWQEKYYFLLNLLITRTYHFLLHVSGINDLYHFSDILLQGIGLCYVSIPLSLESRIGTSRQAAICSCTELLHWQYMCSHFLSLSFYISISII